MTSIPQYVLYFDGGSSGNPGPSGSGSVLYQDGVEVWSDSHYVGDRETNNTAEYTGLIRGLEEIVSRDIQNVQILGDSQLVIRQMKGEYKVSSPHLQLLHAKAQDLVTRVPQIEWQHIPRALNKRADALSRVRTVTDPDQIDIIKKGT
jgi:ribonuclease HI